MMSCHSLVYLLLLVLTTTCSAGPQFKHHDNGYFRNSPCPNAEDIAPCTCHQSLFGAMNMYCYGIEDEQELFNVFHSAMPSTDFGHLLLDTKNLKMLEDTVFGDATFESVWAINGNLEYVGAETFINSASTLKQLFLDYNNLADFPFDTLSQYTGLELLSLVSNPIASFPIIKSETLQTLALSYAEFHTIPQGALDGLPNLVWFEADFTDIQAMPTGLFTSLPKLKDIGMMGTGLTQLESHLFGTNSIVMDSIALYGNQIETVAADAFSGVQSGMIDLSWNKLTILPEDTWGRLVEAGVRLKLKGNDLICGCDVAWLVLEPLYHDQVQTAKCQSGEMLVNLNPHIFDDC